MRESDGWRGGLDIILCEFVWKEREGDRGRESEGDGNRRRDTLSDRVRPRVEQEA